jgi:hypothetical protein
MIESAKAKTPPIHEAVLLMFEKDLICIQEAIAKHHEQVRLCGWVCVCV